MKINLRKSIVMVSKYFMIGFIVQLIILSTSFAKNVDAQLNNRIHANLLDVSVKQVFNILEESANVTFVYDTRDVNSSQRLSITGHQLKAKEVLDLLTSKLGLCYKMIGNTITLKNTITTKKKSVETEAMNAPVILHSLFPKTSLQGIDYTFPVIKIVRQQVSGTVTGSLGNPLNGVTVQVKGTQQGTTTNAQGHYQIDVSKNVTLVFSYVGYQKMEVPVNGRNTIDITLSALVTGLNEVVVVGYGTQKKINVTGAISTVTGKELTESPSINLSNSLIGRMPGLVAFNTNGIPGSGSKITIRGLGSLNDNSPLIVVDGVVRGSFSQIDPNAVASVTILKDASAAVYGARAANGVILVTTKHGKIGKPEITYTGDFGIQQPTQYPKLMNGYQYASIHNVALINQGYDPNNPADVNRFFSDQELADFKSGKTGVDWYDLSFKKNPMVTHHNLSVSGGSEAIRYFASIGYVNQDGMYDNINFKRYNFRANVDASISKNFRISLGLDGRQENHHDPGYDANEIFMRTVRRSPAVPMAFYPDGKLFLVGGEHIYGMIYESGYQRATNSVFHGILDATWDLPFITPGLSLSGKASWGRGFDFDKNFILPYKMYTEDSAGNVTMSTLTGPETNLTEIFRHSRSSFYNISLNYMRDFGKHNVGGLLLFEASQSGGDYMEGNKRDFSSDVKDELFASGAENQIFDGYGFLSNARQSLVGRINYNYNNKYLLEASFRYDGSYIFPKENRFGFFPAVSAGWVISEESFIKGSSALSFIDFLKIRASKGLLGNDRVRAFQYEDSYTIHSVSGPVFGGAPVSNLIYGVFPNPLITWEKADITDVGLEGTLWNGLLGFEIDYFFKHTWDILWSKERSVPATFGRSLPDVNYAVMDNQGIELRLTHRNHIREFHYNIGAQVSYSKNEVVQIDDPPNAPDYKKQLGKSVGYIAGYKALGLFQSDEEAQKWYGGKEFGLNAQAGDIKYADVDGDGKISSSDQIVLSNYNQIPRIIFGMTLGADWHNFDLRILLQGGAQNNLLMQGAGRVLFQIGGTNNNFTYLMDSWSPENKDAKYPLAWVGSRSINNRNSSFWLKKDAYARLKSMQLGYTFKQPWIQSKGIERLRVYVSGFNLLTISQVPMFDPEADNNNYGGSGAYYPQQRIFNAGVALTF